MKQQAISSGNVKPTTFHGGEGFAPMQSQTPGGHAGPQLLGGPGFDQQIMANRKAKFMQHQQNKSGQGIGQQIMASGSAKNKVNLSAELNVPTVATGQNFPSGPAMPNVQSKNGKPISMSSIAYDRIKGLTPVGGKSSGQALKNSFHLHNQMHLDNSGNGQ